MKKNNLMLMGMTVFMLTACGSSEDVDAVAAGMSKGSAALSETDAQCVAKSLKKELPSDVWDMRVDIANGDARESDLSSEDALALLAPLAVAAKKCDVDLGF
jgi:hypothetical protein